MNILNYDDMTPEQQAEFDRMADAEGVEIPIPEWLDPKDIPLFLEYIHRGLTGGLKE